MVLAFEEQTAAGIYDFDTRCDPVSRMDFGSNIPAEERGVEWVLWAGQQIGGRAARRLTEGKMLGTSLAEPVKLLRAGDGIGHGVLATNDHRTRRNRAPVR